MAQYFMSAPFRLFAATRAGFQSSDPSKFPHRVLRRVVFPDYLAGMRVCGRKLLRGVQPMKRFFGFGILLVMCAAPAMRAQDLNHVEVGVFADYFRLGETSPRQNFIGLG